MPAPDGVTFEVNPPLKELEAELRRERERLKQQEALSSDWMVMMKKVGVFLDRWVQLNFRSEGGKVGGWTPLAPSTIAGRVRRNLRSTRQGRNIRGRTSAVPISAGRFKMLQVSGRLRSSYHPFAKKDDAGIGSKIPYAEPLHKGASKPGTAWRLPARPQVPEHKHVDRDIRKIIGGHVDSIKAGFARAFRRRST